LLLEN
jgi:hypothetical protein